jgi:RHS repeat-associated protein
VALCLLLVWTLVCQTLVPTSWTVQGKPTLKSVETSSARNESPDWAKQLSGNAAGSVVAAEPATPVDPPPNTLTDAVISRGHPNISAGRIEGTLRLLQGESFALGGNTQILGDVLIPGSPSIQLNGGAQHGGVVNDGGAVLPNSTLTLSGGIVLPGKIHIRSDAPSLPSDFPSSVPAATGSRTVSVNSQSDIALIGDWQTVSDLSVTKSGLTINVPPGNYGTFTVNGNSRLNFTAGSYNFANTFNLDGSASLQATGVVTINVDQNLTINSGAIVLGSYTAPGDVHLNVLGSSLKVNGSSQVSGMVRAYNGTVTLNGTAQVRGQVIANTFTLNGGKVIGAVWPAHSGGQMAMFGPRRFDRTTGPANQYLEQFALPPGVTSPFTLHIQNGEPNGSNRVSSATIKLNGTEILIQSDLNQNVASIDRIVTLNALNTLEVRLTSNPGSYLIINISGPMPVTDNTPPALSVTSPANNTTTSAAQINFSGTASDTGTGATGVAHIYVNGLEATFNQATSTWSIAGVPLELGANQILVRAVDGAGNETTTTVNITRAAPNHAPTVDAGPDQNFALPHSATLHGTVSDDGLPAGSSLSVIWSVVSNPGSVAFTNVNSLDTTATFGSPGTYVLRLTASDGDLSTSDDITLTVEPANQPPTVNAGANQTVALPHTATLNGTVTDDGLPAGSSLSILWSQVSGPGTTAFENPLLSETVASFSAAGTYVLRLTATDGTLTASNEVTITVHPENHAPTVNAGTDQSISLPAAAQLNGSATDDGWPFGSTLSLVWTAVSGPGSVTFANPNVSVTSASFSAPGTYLLRLTAGDGELETIDEVVITVTPPNQAPSVNAGSAQTITLPAPGSLNGTVSDDGLPLGSSVSASWSKVSGPGEVIFANASQAATMAQFSSSGAYVLRLTATDGALGNSADVAITVIPENHAPTVNAGADQTVTLPNLANLNGSAGDDGLPAGSTLTTTWSKVSGPGTVTFGNPNVTVTTAAFSVAGPYVLRLTASDSGLTSSDDIEFIVIPENHAPTVSAGTDQTITLPNTVNLSGVVNDDGLPGGSTLTVSWTKVSGPGLVSFSNPNAATTSAAFDAAGTYVLRLTGTDSQLSNSDEVQVTVIPENHAPTANAGADQSITLPALASLNGSAGDDGLPGGSTLTTTWSKVSGPGTVTFGNPSVTVTTAAFSEAGIYVLRLTATDSDLNAEDEITVRVIAENHPPSVDAGASQTITLPNSASLNGSILDDGLPAGSTVTSVWTKSAGPGTVSFANANSPVTTASFSVSGTYELRLTASDSELSTYSNVAITVIAQNHAPTANAGADQTITLPNTASLNGSATDDGLPAGSTLTTNWSKVSGPGTVTFGNPSVTVTTAAFSEAGTYVLRLNSTDSDLNAEDQITVTVIPENHAPTANAGADQTITLPTTANLSGATTDDSLPAGSTLTTTWSKVSGPGTVTFANANLAVTTAAFSEAGSYVLRLTASDSQLTTTDEIAITVIPENHAPTVNAGADQTITLPNTASLNGSASDDGLPSGSTLTSTWSKVSGPGVVTFASPNATVTSASFSVAGTYVLRLTASDSALSGNDEIQVTAIPENHSPTANAGADSEITLPNSASLNGAVSDDGLPSGSTLSSVWSKFSGPGIATFANPNHAVTTVTFSVAGTYVLRLTATDSALSASDDITITVKPQNQAPSANAGPDQTINTCSTSLQGVATDDGLPAGSSLAVSWSKVSGPGTVNFANSTNLNTSAAFNLAGNYVLRLTVSDSLLTASDDVAISVSTLSNAPPSYIDPSASPYLSFQDSPFKNLSTSYFYNEDFEDHLLNTPGVTADTGGVTSVIWGTSAHDSVDADDGLIDGNGSNGDCYYAFIGSGGVKFTFNASVLGSLPTHAGLVWTDGAGTVSFEAFDRNGVSMGIRGPFDIADSAYFGATAEDRFLGAYNPQGISAIRVLNTSGGMEVDHLQYGFGNGANTAPVVNAGADQTLILPITTATLNGTVTDDGLPGCATLTFSWSQVSGPGTVTFANPNALNTTATFSVVGTYVLRLTANDSALSSSDEVTIIASNAQPPVANFVVPESTGTAGAFVIASSGFTGSAFSADKLLDDTGGTYWQTQGITNQFAKMQFFDQQNVFIDRVRLQAPTFGSPTTLVKDFDVQISATTSDDASFVTVLSGTLLNNTQMQEFVLPGGPVRTRFLKLLLKTNYGNASSFQLGTFNPVAVGSADSLLSLPGQSNVARSQSPALPLNGGAIYNATYPGGAASATNLIGYFAGGWQTNNSPGQFAIIRLAGGKSYTIEGVRLATWYDSGYGFPTGVKDFEVWVSNTTPDDTSFTKVLTATAPFVPNTTEFLFPGGPVQARYVKYVPLTNGNNGTTINTQSFDVIATGTARVVGVSQEAGQYPNSASAAFDGVTTSNWIASGTVTNVWVKTALANGATQKIYGVRIHPMSDPSFQQGPKDFDIRVSTTTTDDSAFSTVYSGTVSTANAAQEFVFSNFVDARYVQFFWKNAYHSSVLGVKELEVLAAPERGSGIISFSNVVDPVATLLDLDSTNQPWTTPLNQNSNVSFKLVLPRAELTTINHIALRPAIAFNGNYNAPKDFQFQVSTTNSADASFATAFAGTLVSSIQLQDFYFAPVQAKYVRLVLLKGPNDFGSYALHNFFIYSSTTIGTSTRFVDRSSDPDGQVVSWAWNFGDGTTSTLKNPAHTFAQAGDYTVLLTVTDNNGLSSSYSNVYHVVDSLTPDLTISPMIAHEGGESVRFMDVQNLLSVPTALRTYDFGDGSPLYTQYSNSSLYTYPDNGVFHVTLKVGDSLGVSHSITRDITVLNLVPSVDIDPGKTLVWGESWTSVPRITDQSPVDRLTLQGQWTFGDGQTSQCVNCTNANATVTHAYAHPGAYQTVLTVTDKDGGVGSDSADFIINKRPTALIFQNPPAQTDGQPLVIHAQLMDTFANQPLIGKPVQFKVNGASFNTVTGANGVAQVSVPLPAGTRIDVITGSFAEDEYYLSCGGVAVPPTAGGTPPASSASHQGTNFWLMFPYAYFSNSLPVQTLYITSPVATTGTVTIPGLNYTQNFTVQANTVLTMQLPFSMVYENNTVTAKGIHVVSQLPVAVYGLDRLGFSSDAFLGLPVSAIGMDYYVLTYSNMGFAPSSELGVVATENSTVVTITPSVTSSGHAGGVPFNVTLNQGQTYLLQNLEPTTLGDLSGSRVTANKPIAVFAGHEAATIPAESVCCADHLVEQLPPTGAWGKRFATVPLATRTKGDFFRFIAAEDATAVYLNGNQTALLNRGQWVERIIKNPAEIIATAPIMVTQYSTSIYYDPPTTGKADPFTMTIPPYSQFLNHYTITTPATGFQFNYANVVAPTASLGSITMDGTPIPAGSFTPIGVSGYSGAQVTIPVGAHNFDGPVSFGVFVYGYNQDEGYGYPGGMNMTPTVQSTNVAVTPETSSHSIQTGACVVAAVTNQDQYPLGGRTINFTVTGVNPSSSSATSDAAGRAQFCYTGMNTGSDLVTAAVGSASGTASVQWQTNVPNQAPVVSAGADQMVTLPASGNLQGSASDDGLPVNTLNLSWSKVSGPGNVTFTTPSAAVTSATFDAPGVYVLRLTASDSSLSTSDDVQVTVNPVPTNQSPTANAGPDRSVAVKGNLIVNPGNEEPLVNGEIPGWIEEQGTTWTQGNSSTAGFDAHRGQNFFYVGSDGAEYAELRQDVDVSAFAATITTGSQQFEFQTFVRSAPEFPYPDHPGIVVEFRNAQNTGVLATMEGGNGYAINSWPLTETIQAAPVGTGWIRVRLIATRSMGGLNDAYFDSVSLRPIGSAAVKLTGAVTDDGLPYGSSVSANWTKVSGPGAVTFGNANAASSGASFTTPGTYVLRLTGSDGQANTSDDVTITVYPQNQPPVVSGGTNQTITLPATATLNGIVNDDGLPHGSSVSTRWKKDTGPGAVTFANPNALSTTASFSTQGFYVLILVADDSEYSANTPFYVNVNPAPAPPNQPPAVNPGANQTISLPTNTVTLNGTATDDGLPAGSTFTITWSKVSGPGVVTFGNANSAATTAQLSAVGSYVLRLSASDGAYLVSADVGVILAPQNFAPTANAGPDQTTMLAAGAQLNGSASDDGLPAGSNLTTNWTKVSGPGTVTFMNPNVTITGAQFSAIGTYVLRLTASDGALTGSDELTVIVNDNVAPPGVEITAPTADASVTEPTAVTGSVSGGAWTLEYSLGSDDNANNRVWTTFANGNGATSGTLGTLDPTMMLNGLFDIRLSATDSYGQTSWTKVSVFLEGNLKVGNFTVSFTDLNIPVAGVPMEVTRTYDSRDKRVGDFGFGWTMGLRNIRVEKAGVIGLKWYETASQEVFPNYCLQPLGSNIVSVTFPGGKVFKFKPTTTPRCQRFAPITGGTVSFSPLPGTHGTLQVVGAADFQIDGSVPGPVNLVGFGGGVDIFNSFVFKFTAEDGTAFVIDQRSGLQSIADLNGNTVTIGTGGIVHSNGKSITFARDGLGRITSVTDPNGNSQTYTYNTNGDLVSYTDNENHTSTYTYDANHRLLTIHDPRGIQPIRNDYDADGRLISHTDGFGKVITYIHNLAARTETVTDRMGQPTVFEYDERGSVLRKTDARGGVTTFTYDANNNVLTETNALGKTTTYTYDANDHPTSITDPLGHVRQFTYNALGKVLTTTDPLGHVTTNTYNAVGNLLTTTDALNHTTTQTYSVFDGQPISMTDVLNNTTTYDYSDGFLSKQTDALGHETNYQSMANGLVKKLTLTRTLANNSIENIVSDYQYDRLSHLTQTTRADGSVIGIEYNSIGKQKAIVEPSGQRITYDYDDMGQLILTSYTDGTTEAFQYDAEGRKTQSTDRAGRATAYVYDELGRKIKTTHPDGTFTTTTYDAAGQVLTVTDERNHTTHYEYDAAGRRVKVKNALNEITSYAYDLAGNQISMTDANGHTVSYEYNLLNRQTKVTYPDGTFSTTAYDAAGKVIAKIDQAGKSTQFEYDKVGQLVKVTDALGQVTSFAYNEAGQQISQTDALNRTTRYEYDKFGRKIKRILPLGMSELFTYDPGGNVQSHTDFNGRITTYQYDVMNRLLTKTPDPSLNQSTISFTYTVTGKRATMNDASGSTTYTYDGRNRLSSKQTPFGTLSYSYDAASNLSTTRSSNASGVSVDYGYDSLNRLATVKDNYLLALNGGITNYSYDPVGNLQSYAYPNTVTTSYGYNSQNRLTTMTSATPLSTVASYAYTLGAAGNRTAVTELSGRTVNYNHDALYRLTSESIVNDSHGVNGSVNYNYDPVGNRLGRNSTVAPLPSQNSTYDANDRLSSDGYDNNGNTISASSNTYAYDFENHLTTENGGAVTYLYDGDGNRVSKTVASVTTNYLVDTNNPTGYAQVVEELQSGAVVRSFTYGQSRISQRIVGGTLSFYQYDGQGSVRSLTNPTAAITDTYDYDAFGNLLYRSGSTPNDYLYTGEQLDANLGFYYLRARYLNPAAGRFLSMDSFGGSASDPISLHKYLYANADPVDKNDPSGNFATTFDVTFAAPLNLSTISIRLLQLVTAVGVGVEIARYLDRRWRMWTAVKVTPNFHACMVAQDTQRGRNWSYDVGGLTTREYVESKQNPFTAFEGILTKTASTGDEGRILPVGRMTDWQLQIFEVIMMGGSAGADEPFETPFAYAFAYRNCLTWTITATATARIVSLIPS